ncbi:MAG: hypothetical protein MR654_04245 [Corynebacterium glucuronolyticum]|nr:hypothetical protein [Corynebacterium glucuronolyticum]
MRHRLLSALIATVLILSTGVPAGATEPAGTPSGGVPAATNRPSEGGANGEIGSTEQGDWSSARIETEKEGAPVRVASQWISAIIGGIGLLGVLAALLRYLGDVARRLPI